MRKQTGAILLIAGTCIGSGMIALPMVLAKIGLIPSLLVMLLIWGTIYFTSLVNLELNLQAGTGLSLGALGRKFSGTLAEFLGNSSLKVLCYSLLAVYIQGGSSVIQKLTTSSNFNEIATWYAAIAVIILWLPIKLVDYTNRFLFIALMSILAVLLGGLVLAIDWSNLPLFATQYSALSVWAVLLPVVFTSFGFQVIFHTLTDYCNKDVQVLKKAFFWGSLIPAIVYILWTCGSLSVIYSHNPIFYTKMAFGQVEVGELVAQLSAISKLPSVQLLVWWVSILAIATSAIGVSKGLCDAIKAMLSSRLSNVHLQTLAASLITVLPAYLVVIYVPNAFLKALGFAGMTLTIIAIWLPIYLFFKLKSPQLYYPELRKKWAIAVSLTIAATVVLGNLYTLIE